LPLHIVILAYLSIDECTPLLNISLRDIPDRRHGLIGHVLHLRPCDGIMVLVDSSQLHEVLIELEHLVNVRVG